MVDSVFMADLTWPEFEAKTKAKAPFFLPVGATEQHGPHLPLGVDVILPTGVCERVAKRVGGVVAPTIPYGYKSQPRTGGGQAFPGTTSLNAHTLSMVVRDVIHDLALHGVRRLAVVNGHFENSWPVVEGVDLGAWAASAATDSRSIRTAGTRMRMASGRVADGPEDAAPRVVAPHRAARLPLLAIDGQRQAQVLVDPDTDAAARVGHVLPAAVEGRTVEALVAQTLTAADHDGLERPGHALRHRDAAAGAEIERLRVVVRELHVVRSLRLDAGDVHQREAQSSPRPRSRGRAPGAGRAGGSRGSPADA